ncbi:MAG: hypothetical protein RIR18_2347 [Pseudomonadota bacterium]|jgi:type II secretory ATPase GspE/PulE/Tfp pilus assembly ATPase PilB-like protein
MTLMTPHPEKLGQLLINQDLLSDIELELALLEQGQNPMLLGEVLLKLNFIDETSLTLALGARLEIHTPDLAEIVPSTQALNYLPADFIRSEQCLPIRLTEHNGQCFLQVVLAHPQDLVQLDRIRHALSGGILITPCLGGKKALSLAIERLLGIERTHISKTLLRIEESPENLYQGHAAITLVDELLAEAIDQGASDIHFEPDLHVLKMRIRLDGLLRTTHILRAHLWPSLLVRLKLMNGMDISDTRHAQDGRMTVERPSRTIDIRASSLPTLYGENLVLRLLDRNKGIRPLSSLGLAPEQFDLLLRLLETPEGLLLVTGPTGSGKTTTLYAMLRHLQRESLHISTLEDPVEYALPGIRQTAIDPPRLDFADGIRAILRQDPDILLVGEIRDEATAAMTLRAAQTGHRVFSTLHASSPFAALPRLQQLKLPLAALRGSLTGILSQRLLRRLCPSCRIPHQLSRTELQQLGLEHHQQQQLQLHKAKGCLACQQTGYQGQLPLIEILPFSPELEILLDDQHRLSHGEIAKVARQLGWQNLAEHGRQRVMAGETSLEELCRTVSLSTLSTSPAPLFEHN